MNFIIPYITILSLKSSFLIDMVYKGTLQIVPNFINTYRSLTGSLNKGRHRGMIRLREELKE
jgi:hypothetical protein